MIFSLIQRPQNGFSSSHLYPASLQVQHPVFVRLCVAIEKHESSLKCGYDISTTIEHVDVLCEVRCVAGELPLMATGPKEERWVGTTCSCYKMVEVAIGANASFKASHVKEHQFWTLVFHAHPVAELFRTRLTVR